MKVLSIISNGSGHRATFKDEKGDIIVKRFPLETKEADIFAYDPGKEASAASDSPKSSTPPAGEGSGQAPSTNGNGLERLNALREKAKDYGLKPLNVSADTLEAMIKEHEAKQRGSQP